VSQSKQPVRDSTFVDCAEKGASKPSDSHGEAIRLYLLLKNRQIDGSTRKEFEIDYYSTCLIIIGLNSILANLMGASYLL